MSASAEIVAGLIGLHGPQNRRADTIANAPNSLSSSLNASTVWQQANLPAEMRGPSAYGEVLSSWSPPGPITADEERVLAEAWWVTFPALEPGRPAYVRLRVESIEAHRYLRQLATVDGLPIVPSLDSVGGWWRWLTWRWPLRVGIVDGPLADEWLDTLRNAEHHGAVFDAERYDPDHQYEIAIVGDLSGVSADTASALGDATCVIVCGDGQVDGMLTVLQERVEPAIAVAINGPPVAWWRTLLHEMAHDLPIDVAVEAVAASGVDALLAGPWRGLDVTASARWFAAVAPAFPGLAPLLDNIVNWNWFSEGGGATIESDAVRGQVAAGVEPIASIPPMSLGEGDDGPGEEAMAGAEPDLAAEDAAVVAPTLPPAPPSEPEPPTARRLVVRVFDGEQTVNKLLPPSRDLQFAVRIAIPERDDTAADAAAPPLPGGAGATVELEVVVDGDVWADQPPPQTISISRANATAPSTWAVFELTTPAAGEVVSIDVTVLHKGKPLQAATFVSPVRTFALPLERPTLTTYALSGPDEPVEESRTVDVTLDGTGAELTHVRGGGGSVLITDVQDMLDQIEMHVSQVLGVRGAPDALDDPRVVELLVTLAGIGTELHTLLEPLAIGDAPSIDVTINPLTKVLPLELVYDGPPPDDTAKLCSHVTDPPPPGQACTKASSRRVCPYAFWGLHRTISRTVRSTEEEAGGPPWPDTISANTVLYAATVVADERGPGDAPTDGEPPSGRVREAAERLFPSVTQAAHWREWRKTVKTANPDLMVVLGHTMVEGAKTNLYIGKSSALDRRKVSARELSSDGSRRPLVLLIACATAALGDPFGTLPGAWTAKGAGAVVGTLSKTVGPQGATATTHLLQAIHDVVGRQASVGEAVAAARRSLIAGGHPIGLTLVTHGEIGTKVVAV